MNRLPGAHYSRLAELYFARELPVDPESIDVAFTLDRVPTGGYIQSMTNTNPATKTETLDLGNNETLSRGVYLQPNGEYLALSFTRSKTFKTRAGAERWFRGRA